MSVTSTRSQNRAIFWNLFPLKFWKHFHFINTPGVYKFFLLLYHQIMVMMKEQFD